MTRSHNTLRPPRHAALWRALRGAVVPVAVVAGTPGALLLAPRPAAAQWLPAIVFAVSVVVTMSPARTFRRRLAVGVLDSCARGLAGAAIAAMLSILAGTIIGAANPDLFALHAWILTSALFCGACTALSAAERRARAHGLLMVPTLIVGAGIVGRRVARRLGSQPSLGLRPVGFLDANPRPGADDSELELPVLGTPSDAVEIAARAGAVHVIFAFSWEKDHEMAALARRCQAAGLEVATVPRLYESVNGPVTLDHIGGLPLMSLRQVSSQGWRWTSKYAVDRLAATAGLFLLGPLMLAIALAIRISSPGPVIYRQRRVGREGREFDLLKFRSMALSARAPAFMPGAGLAPGGVEGTDRRTSLGRFLRGASLDELPQLLNVVRGEMSLVGPRPERPEFVARFAREMPRYSDRHRVRPGITGWAQVNGLRGQTSIEDRVEWDNHYIENWSLRLELRTLALTTGAVLSFREDGQVAQPRTARGVVTPASPPQRLPAAQERPDRRHRSGLNRIPASRRPPAAHALGGRGRNAPEQTLRACRGPRPTA